MDTDVLYSADQIKVPADLGAVLKEFTKEVIRVKPSDIARYAANYFAKRAGLALPFPEIPVGVSKAARALQISRNAVQVEAVQSAVAVFSEKDIALLLKRFQNASTADGLLSRAAFLSVMKEFLNVSEPEYAARALRLFEIFDVDRSGSLNAHEFLAGMALLFSPDRKVQIDLAFKTMDNNGDGIISVEEFVDFMKSFIRAQMSLYGLSVPESDWIKCYIPAVMGDFHSIDTDGSGSIDMKEFIAHVERDPAGVGAFKLVGEIVDKMVADRSEAELDDVATFRDLTGDLEAVIESLSAALESSSTGKCEIQ